MNPWTVACQAPLSVGILQARILEWVAMPSSRGSPNPGIELRSSALQADSLQSEPLGKSFHSNSWLYSCWCHKACVRLDSQLDCHTELPSRWKQTPALKVPSRYFVKDTIEKSWQIWEDWMAMNKTENRRHWSWSREGESGTSKKWTTAAQTMGKENVIYPYIIYCSLIKDIKGQTLQYGWTLKILC